MMASLADQLLDDLSSQSENESDVGAAGASERSDAPDESTSKHGEQQPRDELEHLLRRVRDAQSSNTQDPDLLQACVVGIASTRGAVSASHARLRDMYTPRFPELGAILPSAREYASAVRVLRNSLQQTSKLSEILSSGTVITIEIAASRSQGRPLDDDEVEELDVHCRELERLEAAENELLGFVDSRANDLAPNVAAIVGGAVAAQLLGEAGSIEELSRVPGCNMHVLGKTHRSLQGRSTAHARRHQGVLYSCPLVQSLPPSLWKKGADMVGNKTALAARVDAAREKRDGSTGRALRAQIEEKFEKWQEPPPARTAKPLPVPDEVKKRHRAGKRARRQKELYGMSEMRKRMNHVKFGQAEGDYGNDDEGGGLGLLGTEGVGKLRAIPKQSKSTALAANRRLARQAKQASGPSDAVASGITTVVNGLEFGTKTPAPGGVGLGSLDAKDGTQSNYFSAETPFLSARRTIRK